MKLFEYKPTEYVDVHPDLPLEWMQQEIDKTQNKYDAKLNTVNDLNKEFYSMQAGAQTEEELKAINAEYSKRINDMVSGLTNTGYIPQTSADLAKFINEVSFDPRVKRIKEDRALYEKHLENVMKPENAGAFNMLDTRKPDSPYNPNLYKVIPPADSVAKSRNVAQTMHPSTIDNGKTWTVKDPFSGEIVTKNSYDEAVGVSKDRIKQYTDYNYVNWKTDPDSYFDRMQLSNGDLAFWDTPEGKALYDQKMKALEPLAYQTNNNTKTGTQGTGTKPAKPTEEKDDKIMNAQPTATKYGDREGFGLGHDGTKITDYFGVMDEERWNKMEYLNTSNEINKLKTEGVSVDDPRIVELQRRKDKAKNDIAVWDTWRHKVEGDNYGKMDAGDFAIAQEEARQSKDRAMLAVQKQIMSDLADGTLNFVNAKGVDLTLAFTEIWPALRDGLRYGNAALLMQPFNTNEENAQAYLDQYDKEWKKALEGTPSGEIIAMYDAYKNYQTSGMSYVVPEDKKNQMGTLVKDLLNKGTIAKDVVSDTQLNAELQKELYEGLKNKETQVYEFDRLSPEILLDEKDGPVLVLHGLRDEDGGVIALEYSLQDTPGIREKLYDMLPEEQRAKLTSYVEATESLKAGGRKKGQFTIPRYDSTSDVIEFSRHPIQGQPGKWEYVDSDKNKYSSINDLIDVKGAKAAEVDRKMLLMQQQVEIAFANGDYEKGNLINDALAEVVSEHRIERGLSPDTGKPMTASEKIKYKKQAEENTEPVINTTPTTTSSVPPITPSSSGKQQPQTQSNSLGWK
jgi:hypothetical protein